MKNNNVGRLTCPICGEPLQDLRVDKGHKLYMYCDNYCAIKLNGKQSKKYLALLMSGQDIQTPFGLIKSLKEKKEDEQTISRTTGTNTEPRANVDGRSGINTGANPIRNSAGGFLRGIFSGDDDEF